MNVCFPLSSGMESVKIYTLSFCDLYFFLSFFLSFFILLFYLVVVLIWTITNKKRKKERKTKTIMKRKVDPVFLVVQCYCKAPCDHMKRGADNCTVHHYCYCNYSYVAVVPTCISMEENTK